MSGDKDVRERGTQAMTELYLGDLRKTALVRDLFEVSHERRQDNWIKTFYQNIVDASFQCGTPQVMRGPDGFNYFVLRVPEEGKPFQCFVLRHMVGDFLLREGLGVVFEPSPEAQPQWVFSYGDIVGFSLTGAFGPAEGTAPAPSGASSEVIQNEEEVLIAHPSESLLPSLSRAVLRRFLQAQGLKEPKVFLMMRRNPTGGVFQEFVFNLGVENLGTEEKSHAVGSWIGWFLPRGYRYASVDEESFKSHFQAL